MAELHGCGEAAKRQARSQWMESHSTNKPLKEEDKEKARQQLKNKVGHTVFFFLVFYLNKNSTLTKQN